MGYRHYDNNTYYRSSAEELFDKNFLEAYAHDLHINQVSSEGRAEAYNLLWHGSQKEQFFQNFIAAHKETGGHFRAKRKASADIFEDKDEEAVVHDIEEPAGADATVGEHRVEVSTMNKLGRRNLSTGFYNHEVVAELTERGMLHETTFGPKADAGSKSQTYKASLEEQMKKKAE